MDLRVQAEMTEYKQAKLAFVTEPEPGVYLINLDDGKKFTRVRINGDQLANLISDGARIKYQTGGGR
jgi:hypothetical protein